MSEPKATPTDVISVRLPEQQRRVLGLIAVARQLGVSTIAAEALREWMETNPVAKRAVALVEEHDATIRAELQQAVNGETE